MQGDKVRIESVATEMENDTIYTTEISEKPQFMLEEEYHQQIIKCVIEAVKKACKTVYPMNESAQIRIAKVILNMATGVDI